MLLKPPKAVLDNNTMSVASNDENSIDSFYLQSENTCSEYDDIDDRNSYAAEMTELYHKNGPYDVEEEDEDVLSHTPTYLRVVLIPSEGMNCHLVFRFDSNDQHPGWYEFLLHSAIQETNSWAHKLNFSHNHYYWMHKDVLQRNAIGCPITLFHMTISTSLPDVTSDTLSDLCKYICNMVTYSNYGDITFDIGSLSWLEGDVVWADVIGTTEAVSVIHSMKGTPYQGFYEQNEDFLLTFFRKENTILTAEFFKSECITDTYPSQHNS